MLCVCVLTYRSKAWAEEGAIHVFQEERQERDKGGSVGWLCGRAFCLSSWRGEGNTEYRWATISGAITVFMG